MRINNISNSIASVVARVIVSDVIANLATRTRLLLGLKRGHSGCWHGFGHSMHSNSMRGSHSAVESEMQLIEARERFYQQFGLSSPSLCPAPAASYAPARTSGRAQRRDY